jgi:hypothetical protein
MPEDLKVTFSTWEQADSTTLERFHDLIVADPLLQQEKLGPYEPLEHDFDDISAESFARTAIEERSLIAQRYCPPEQVIFYTNRSGARKPNVFSHSMERVEEGSDEAKALVDYAYQLFNLFEPAYGRLYCKADYREKNLVQGAVAANAVGIDLRKHLPGIYWGNFFGPRYVDFLGEDRLLTAPAHEARWLGEAGILLLVSESPFEYDDPEVKATEQAVVEHLGPEAFFFKSDPEDKEYRAPDLSDLPQFAPEANGQT